MGPADITSPSNERIKRLVRLRDRRHRDAEGVFVVEGARLYDAAIDSGQQPLEVYVVPSHPLAGGAKTTTVDSEALDRASYRDSHDGLIAVFPQLSTSIEALDIESEPVVIVVEDVEKPGNLGAILRSADAFGADAVIATGAGADVHNPNVLRASTGAVFTTRVAATSLEEALEWLTAHRIPLIAMTPDRGQSLWDVDLGAPIALAFGSEDVGVSETLARAAEARISIPMHGSVDSLNVSVTVAITLAEMARRRTAV